MSLPVSWRQLWLGVGYFMILIVFYMSLTSHPMQMHSVPFADKYGHFLSYFILHFWFACIYQKTAQRLFIAGCFVSMGIGIEFIQDLNPQRSFEVADMVADGLGVVMAYLLTLSRMGNSFYYLEHKYD
jgi:VanZ family protein